MGSDCSTLWPFTQDLSLVFPVWFYHPAAVKDYGQGPRSLPAVEKDLGTLAFQGHSGGHPISGEHPTSEGRRPPLFNCPFDWKSRLQKSLTGVRRLTKHTPALSRKRVCGLIEKSKGDYRFLVNILPGGQERDGLAEGRHRSKEDKS